MADNELERIYTIPLRKAKAGSQNKAANRAVREVRDYLERHMKSDDVWIDAAVNRAIWAHGMYKIPSKIRVRAIKFEDGVVEVSLPEEEATTSIRDSLREARESKTPILPTPTVDEDEVESETGEIEAEPEVPDKSPSAEDQQALQDAGIEDAAEAAAKKPAHADADRKRGDKKGATGHQQEGTQ